MPPCLNFCRAPPGTEVTGDTGRPGLHINASYLSRIAPVTFLFLLTQMRPSHAEIAARISAPVTEADPDAPRTLAVMMRPPLPRLIVGKPWTMPMPPVYGDSRLVSSAAVSVRFQSVHGFAAVSSPGSHSALR